MIIWEPTFCQEVTVHKCVRTHDFTVELKLKIKLKFPSVAFLLFKYVEMFLDGNSQYHSVVATAINEVTIPTPSPMP